MQSARPAQRFWRTPRRRRRVACRRGPRSICCGTLWRMELLPTGLGTPCIPCRSAAARATDAGTGQGQTRTIMQMQRETASVQNARRLAASQKAIRLRRTRHG